KASRLDSPNEVVGLRSGNCVPRQRLTTAKGHAAERLPRHRDTSAVGSHFLENGETLCPPESPK
ncbi:MAG: hypothetical protein VXZ53_00340, partial [Planctomycetota bacterium]|nr:hypothetical protein [Planctomycetota bacterium]